MKHKSLTEEHHSSDKLPTPAERPETTQSVVAKSDWSNEETVRIRDLHQFEIKLHYPLSRKKGVTLHDLECYVFVPDSLGMNRENYSKARFYDDLQAYIRFKTPAILLTRLVGDQDSPLAKLEASAMLMLEGGPDVDVSMFEYRLKLFCCILQSSLRDFVAFIGETTDPDDRDRLVQQYLHASKAVAKFYRTLRSMILLPTTPRLASAIFVFGDEYVSLLIERSSYDLLELLRVTDALVSHTCQREIMDLVAHEVRYRESRQYLSIPTDKNDNEQFIYRRNVLKKYMQNVLFLDTRTQNEGKVIEQGLFAVAAGISMLFATVVLFLSQSIYGPLTLPVFLALVVGYMFKDRIKEMLRVYFSRKVSSFLFDHKTNIYSGPRNRIGSCRESFDFVDETKIPDRIMKLRNRDHITEIESDWVVESVLRYRRRIKLSSQAVSAAYRDIDTDGINSILRFNVAEFTHRMGDPKKQLFVLEEEGYRRVKAERVYHLNMILRYGGDGRVRFKRLRIVLNRRRIKRIETVSVEED